MQLCLSRSVRGLEELLTLPRRKQAFFSGTREIEEGFDLEGLYGLN